VVRIACSSLVAFGVVSLVGCNVAPKHFTTAMELVQAEPMKDETGLTTYSHELKYADCPGDTR
jgi:hypothetical protein